MHGSERQEKQSPVYKSDAFADGIHSLYEFAAENLDAFTSFIQQRCMDSDLPVPEDYQVAERLAFLHSAIDMAVMDNAGITESEVDNIVDNAIIIIRDLGEYDDKGGLN